MSERAEGVIESDQYASQIATFRPIFSHPSSFRSVIGAFLRGIPTLLVLAFLAAVGWWGHHSSWKLPKFSELSGQVEEKDDWCAEHGVPESICVECNDRVMPKPKAKGWCKIHGIPECTLCYPNLAQLLRTPTVDQADLEKAKQALDFTERPENNPICRSHLRRIQFVDDASVRKAGVEAPPVQTTPAVEFVSAAGEIGYDETRVAHMSSRAHGSVARVFKRLGETVRRGEVLMLVESADVGKAKAELLQQFATLGLRKDQFALIQATRGGIPASHVQVAEAAVRETEIRMEVARQMLVNLGLPIEPVDLQSSTLEQLKVKLQFLAVPFDVAKSLDPGKSTSNLLPLAAPMDGVVTSRDVVAGEVVDSARILFEIVDTRFLWITFDLKAEDARRVQLGHPVRFKPDGGKEELAGILSWISPQADPKTRTIKARADLLNSDGKQRANTFGSGRVILREEAKVVSVPNEAIQSDGCCLIVFVRDKNFLEAKAPKVFHVRKVRIGARDDAKTEIIAGILPGENVVTKGSGLLLTELLRDNLGEGCACHSKK